MLTKEERMSIVCGRMNWLPCAEVMFVRKFCKPAPTSANIRILINKFQITGSVMDETRSGRQRTSPEILQLNGLQDPQHADSAERLAYTNQLHGESYSSRLRNVSILSS